MTPTPNTLEPRYALRHRDEDAAAWAERAARSKRHASPGFPIRGSEAGRAVAEQRADETGTPHYVARDTRDRGDIVLVYSADPRQSSARDTLLVERVVEPLPVLSPAELRPCPVCGGAPEPRDGASAAAPRKRVRVAASPAHAVRCPQCGATTAEFRAADGLGGGVRDPDARAALAWNLGEIIMARDIVLPPSAREERVEAGAPPGSIAFAMAATLRAHVIHHLWPMLDGDGRATPVRAWLASGAHRRLVRLHHLGGGRESLPSFKVFFEVLEERREDRAEADRVWARRYGLPETA